MHTLTVHLTDSEWLRVQREAGRQWPQERLSRTEALRRVLLAGAIAFENASKAQAQPVKEELQQSQIPTQDEIKRTVLAVGAQHPG